MSRKSLFATEKGDLGLGSSPHFSIDQIWALETGRVRFILRPVPNFSSSQLIGKFHIHGSMDGRLFADGPCFFGLDAV